MRLPYGWLVHLNKGHFHFKAPPDDPVAYARWEFDEGKKVWERFFASRISLDSKDVLDIACGPGGKSCYYAIHSPNRIIGIDVNPKLIREAELAKSILIPPGHRFRAEFVTADASDLPFPDEYFDIITCSDAFEHFPEPEKVLIEATRVLKTGGLFCIDFAQFCSWNGHHLRDFFRLPWVHVFWLEEDIVNAVNEIARDHLREILDLDLREKLNDMVARRLDQWGNGLNRISLRDFERMLRSESGLRIKWQKKTAMNPFLWPFIFIPGIRELAVARNVYILERV